LVVGILGTLKAGGAYVPLDNAYPRERLAFVLSDSRPAALVTTRGVRGQVPDFAGPVVDMETDADALARHADADPMVLISRDNLAYVIYTSGSTGQPKGALITHGNVVRLFRETDHWFGFSEQDVWTLFHSYAFDFSVWELWGALLYGGRVIIVSFDVSRSPEAFRALLSVERVTVLNQTPSAFRQLIHADAQAGSGLALRYVIFGGEALELRALRPWVDRHGADMPRLINMYGITETTVHVTYRPLRRHDIDGAAGSVIGQPIPDLRLYLLDSGLSPVPDGVPGELFVAGGGLARGYLRRDALTADRFIKSPFADRPGDRLYRTGDLARRLPDGDLEYLGRIDDQVKIRGFRIETGEIEAAIRGCAGVRDVVVISRAGPDGEHSLAAYLVAAGAVRPAVRELRAALEPRLPPYMIPAAFVFLDVIPLTPNGKVDRRALPAPPEERPDVGTSYRAPGSEVEIELANIWARVLRLDRVGLDDNFFALGGDSILTIRVVAEARRSGMTVSPLDVFDAPTIAELARRVRSDAPTASEEPTLDEAPLTPIQRWFLSQGLRRPEHWNQAVVFQSRDALDPDRVRRTLVALAGHHDALRVRLTRDGETWAQRLAPADESVRVRALGTVDDAAFARAAAEAQASLDPAAGPVVHGLVARVGNRELLHLAIHHVAVDGVSWRVLREDFETVYDTLEYGQEIPPLPRSTPFLSWAQRLADRIAAGALTESAEAWSRIEGDADPIPTDVPGARADANLEGTAVELTDGLSEEDTATLLKVLPAATHAQINDLLLGAFAAALHPLVRDGADPLIELEGHGREDLVPGADLSRTVGWFTAIFPVRLPGPDASVFALVRAVKERLQALPALRASFLASRFGSPGSETRSGPAPAILFNYLGQFDDVVEGSARFRFAADPTGPWHGSANRRTHALECLSMVRDGRYQVSLTYHPALHRPETAAGLLAGFVGALRQLIDGASTARPMITTADLRLVRLTADQLADLSRRYPDLDDVLPLSPIQALYHSLAGAAGDIGLDQWHYTLRGPLDRGAFRRAWEATLQRHALLRSCVVTDAAGRAVQVIRRRVTLPWQELDWRAVPEAEREGRFTAFLHDDRRLGFDLEAPPLTRVAVIAFSDTEHRVVWTHHHLQIDGWSWPIVLDDVATSYTAGESGGAHRPAPAYRAYLQWLADRDPAASEAYWRDALADLRDPPLLPGTRRALPGVAGERDGEGRFSERSATLTKDALGHLASEARRLQVTLNTIVQAAWALVLCESTGRPDVVFGAAFSGRPADLPEVEHIVGPFVNNLPLRVRVERDRPVQELLSRMHATSASAGLHQETPLPRIHELSGVAGDRRLFDSLVVFQNYQRGQGSSRLSPETAVTRFAAPVRTNYPITLLAIPGDTLTLSVIADRSRIPDEVAALLLDRVTAVLARLAAGATGPVAALLAALPAVSWPAPDVAERVAPAGATPPPRSDLEQRIAAVWAEVFGCERVGRDDNFYDLGGQSVTMVRLHAKLRDRLDIPFSVARLFQYPTVASLAAALEGNADGAAGDSGIESRGQRQRAAAAAQRRRRGT
jgi:amino acid adenylation domain-containing protein/non-ribosomal peptide synthase protein (TIGR01720 family)